MKTLLLLGRVVALASMIYSASALLTYEESATASCDSDQYFDSTVLGCRECPSSSTSGQLVPTSDCKKYSPSEFESALIPANSD